MVNIIGISAFYHDSAAALLIDGDIISAVQEERFSRKKNDASFPKLSIKYILEANKLLLNDIDFFVFYEKPFLKFNRLLETYMSFAPSGLKQFSKSMPLWIKEKLFQKKIIFDELKSIDRSFNAMSKIKFVEHHLSHASSAFFPSPYKDAVILSLDGVGEWATSSVAIGKHNTIEMVEEIRYPHSLGLLYSAFTSYCGFQVNEGEYKLMGLAPYGKPKFFDVIVNELIDIKEDGSFKLKLKYFDYATGSKMFNKHFIDLFGRNGRSKDEKIDQFYMDIASSIQKVTEFIILRICDHVRIKYKQENLCLAGGVALNCVANGKIREKNIFSNIWVQPAAGDSGGSLGAALTYWYMYLKKDRNLENLKAGHRYDFMKGSYLGPRYKNNDIRKFLEKNAKSYKEYSDEKLVDEVANLIEKQNVIGWFSGRMEFGPRALGSRSIIADPRSEKMQSILNMKVKFRESFRPFAPAVLEEDARDWFKIDCPSPYMLMVSEIQEKIKFESSEVELDGFDLLNIKRSSIPAVTHVDYSARIQTVNGRENRKFFELIKCFKKLTNVPVIINTSFNVRDEPIVCTIEDAFRCFLFTDIDYLVLENFVLERNSQF